MYYVNDSTAVTGPSVSEKSISFIDRRAQA